MDIESIPVPAPLPPSLTTARYEKLSPSESLVLLSWTCERLNDLSPLALYQALALRAEVFVVEQQCIYLDPDGVAKRAFTSNSTDTCLPFSAAFSSAADTRESSAKR